MSDDFISSVSRTNHTKKPENIFFPEIPDPPPGFDPEANPVFKSSERQADKVLKSKKNSNLIPRAKVFIIGSEGNGEFDSLLLRGLSGEVILGKKEVTDLRGSDKYKVYLEWIEVSAKKSR
jgi:hypothetical protein